MEQSTSTTSQEFNQILKENSDHQEQSTLNAGTISDTSHIDALLAEFNDLEEQVKFEKKVSSLMNKEEFSALFFGAGKVCYVMMGYETLIMLDASNPQAVEAIEALYDCIHDVPQLHWMLKPGNIWMQRAFTIGMFFVPFGGALVKEIKQKRLMQQQIRSQEHQKEHQKATLEDFEVKVA